MTILDYMFIAIAIGVFLWLVYDLIRDRRRIRKYRILPGPPRWRRK